MKQLSVLRGVASFASCLLCSIGARAQQGGFALDQLEPAPAGDTFVALPSPYAAGHLALRGYAMFDYASRPIRLAGSNQAVVDAQAFVRGSVSLALFDRLLVDVELPLSVLQSSGEATIAAAAFTPLEAPRIGDLRLGARGRLLGDDSGPITLGLGGYFYAPTGDAQQYVGDGGVRGAFHLPVGGTLDFGPAALHWGAVAGATLRAGGRPQALTYGAAAAVSFADDAVQLGPEVVGSTPLGGELQLSAVPAVPAAASTNLELLGSAKARLFGGLLIGGAAGPGLLSAIGTPTYRVVAMAGWAPAPPRRAAAPVAKQVGDRDGDGTPDDIDACPEQAGEPSPDPKKDGCPPPDRDGDGVPDMDDACSGTPGVRSGDLTQNGCPVDSDGDGYHDGIDACPKQPGEANDDPAKLGCPPDRDADTVGDAEDACPDAAGPPSEEASHNGCPVDPDQDGIQFALDACPFEKGAPHADPKRNGCPEFVRVNKGEIVITQKIEFETYGDSLREAVSANSTKLLSEVRDVIGQHQEMELIEVQGHTDDSGDQVFNLELSQRRAATVRQWLVDHGVAAERLVAKGYGFSRPVADNRVRTGRQRNRRVQFVVLRRRGK